MDTLAIHEKLGTADYVVIGIYLVVLVAVGFWVSFRKRGGGSQDLFLAGRSVKWYNVGLSIFGTNIGPSFLIGSCGIAYTSGMVAANFEWLAWLFIALLALVFIPHYLNLKISTVPQFMKWRYGKKVYTTMVTYAILTTVFSWLGGTLYSGAVLVSQFMGWQLWFSILFLCAIATSFTAVGGLLAVMVTDAMQSVLMILGSLTLTLIAFYHVGGIGPLLESVPAEKWTLIRSSADPTFPWWAMFFGYPVLGVWFWCTDQTIVQRVLGAENIEQGQLGAVFTGFLKIIPPFIFMLPGIMAIVLMPGIENSDEVYLNMVTRYLPHGMIGLIIAVLIALLISTLDSALNSFSTLFTMDIYARAIRPQADQNELKWVGRISTVLVAIVAILSAFALAGTGEDLFNLFQKLLSYVAPPLSAVFLMTVFWKRSTEPAAFWTLILGGTLSITLGVIDFAGVKLPLIGGIPYLAMSFLIFCALCILFVGITLATSHTAEEQVLPTVKETYQQANVTVAQRKLTKTLWIVLAVIMVSLYIIFNLPKFF